MTRKDYINNLQRVQTHRAKLRTQLRAADQEVKRLKRELKALCHDIGKGRA